MRRTGVIALIALGGLLLTACESSPLSVASTTFAPTAPPPPGTPVSGAETIILTPEAPMAGAIQAPGEEHRYTFHAEAGQAVTIVMQAPPGGLLDSYLELRGPDGATLVVNDDGGGGVDSRINNFILPVSGEYTLLAYGFNHASFGSYGLRLSLGTPVPTPTPTPTQRPGGGPISIGETRSGAINTSGQVDLWQLSARPGQYVTINLRAVSGTALDPYLEVLDPDGVVVRADDDSGDRLDARITDLPLTRSGTYTLRVTSVGGSVGAYELALQTGQSPTPTPLSPTPGPSPTPFVRVLTLGEPVEAQLRPHVGGDTYRLYVEEPMAVEILLEALNEQLNLYLEMTEPVSGSQMLVDYNAASSVVYLPSIFLRMRGEYAFRVLGVESRFIDYRLLVNRVDFTTGAGGGPLAYGQGVSGALIFPGQEDVWTFEGRAGDRVTIMMKGAGVDSYLQLFDPTGAQIASNDDLRGASTLDARLERVRLPMDGTYRIVASSYRSQTFGPYRLLLFREGGG